MEFINRILRRSQSSKTTTPNPKPSFKNEADYYEWFFTQNTEWNQATPNYDEQIRWRGIEQYVKRIIKNEGVKPNILDLGCGRGWLTQLLSNYGSVTGIEPVKPVAAFGKQLFPHLNILSGDSNDLLNQMMQNQFDLIVSSEVIEHVEEKNKAAFVKNAHDLLKDAGYIIISTPRKEVLTQYLTYTNPSQPIEDWMTESDVENLFISNGFSKILHQNLTKEIGTDNSTLDIYQLWLFKKI